MRRRRVVAAALVVAAWGVAGAGVERLAPYRLERASGGWVDWLDGEAGSFGSTRLLSRPDQRSPQFRRAAAEAEAGARRRLVETLERTPIDRDSLMGDRPEVMEAVRAAIEAAPLASTDLVRGERVQATLRARLWGDGGLFTIALGRLSPPAAAAPAPEGGEPRGASPAPGGPSASVASPERTSDGESTEVTGLLVDASSLEGVAPALLPRLVDPSGGVVYDPATVDAAILRERGAAGYGVRLEFGPPRAPASLREGRRPLEVKAISSSGAHGTDLVVSAQDARRIAEAAGVSPFLRECRVLVLLPPPRRELPSSGPRRLAPPGAPLPPPPPPPSNPG